MKNTLRIDFTNKRIVMDRTFAKNCKDTMSEEYAHLQTVRKDYPNYEVMTRTIKRNPYKETYKGLTYAYMEDYILNHGTEAEVAEALKEYREKRLISKCHGRGFRYPTIKKWFLEKYPEIDDFILEGLTEAV